MIKLRLKFSDDKPREFEIEDGERLNAAVTRALKDVPTTKTSAEDTWLVVVNGYEIEGDLWPTVALKNKDTVVISPKIRDGDTGQIFKVAAIIAITIAATYFLGPAGYGLTGAALSAATAGATIGATLLLNALIPPPVPSLGDVGAFAGTISSSQMYSIDSQSNTVKRLDTVPKVYGTFRMFPNIAAMPYTELATSAGTYARALLGSMLITAKDIGQVGNNVIMKFQSGGIAGSETVTVVQKANESTITLTFASGASLASQIKAAFDASDSAMGLIDVQINGANVFQDFLGQQNLGGGTDSGDTIQYLYAIYDFGLGTYQVSNLKIGDTPIDTNGFVDFNYNFVDPAMASKEDQYDLPFKDTFQFYKMKREVTPLGVVLNDVASQNIQVTDSNPDSQPQEIILDFVLPRGLFGFSSNGDLGLRNVDFQIEFAPVGTNDWQAFNDLNYVSSHEVVGGGESQEFLADPVATVSPLQLANGGDSYYICSAAEDTPLWGGDLITQNFFTRPGQNKIVVDGLFEYPVGGKIFLSGGGFVGNISSIDSVTLAPSKILTLDRNVPEILAYANFYNHLVLGDTGFPGTVIKWRVVSQASGIATLTGKSTNPVYASIRFTPKAVGQFQVRVRRIQAYGPWDTSTGDQVTWGALTTAYALTPVNTTNRHTFLELKIRATDQLNGNIQTLSGICSSVIPVYDPDTQTWARAISSNPAWIFADILTGQVNKRAISRDRLDMESLVEWADYCDEIPTPPPGKTFTKPRFALNFILDYQTTLQDLLNQIGGAAQASLNLNGGKYGVLIDKFRDTPMQVFTPRNSSGFSSNRAYTTKPDAVDVTWIDPNSTWNQADVTVYDNGFTADNAVNIDTLASFGCTNPEQAWRFGRYMIAQNRFRQENVSILVDFEHLACARGDYVQITQDVMQAGGVAMRVKSVAGSVVTCDNAIDFDPTLSYGYTFRSADRGIITSTCTPSGSGDTVTVNGDIPAVGDLIVVGIAGELVLDCIVKGISPNDDTSAVLTLVEKADDIFLYESTDVLPDYVPGISKLTDPNFKPPPAVTNLVVTDNTWRCSVNRGQLEYYVTLTWDIPQGAVYSLFEIWVNDGNGFRSIATTRSKTYEYSVSPQKLDVVTGFKVVAVSSSGRKLELSAMPTVTITPTTKPSAPSDVENFNIGITDQTLQLSWSAIDDCDAFQYVLRYSPDTDNVTWNSSIQLAVVKSDFTTFACQARTGTYFIKAIDSSGNQSVNAGVAITTIPNLFNINDIQTIDEAPTFIGSLDSTELLGEAVILQEQIAGDINTVKYYTLGYYTFAELLDLGDIYTVRLESLIQADGLKKGEMMSDWTSLHSIAHLSSVTHDDWNVALEYSTSTEFDSMSDWTSLHSVGHINFGGGAGFTPWRDIPQVGDVTGRIFQFRVRLESLTPNVTPRLFDTTVNAYMPDRQESGDNIVSSASLATTVAYATSFAGPGVTPIVQISIDNAASGDYWTFDTKTLDGFAIRIYDKNGTQVSRSFDYVAKGFGHKNSAVI